MKFEYEDLGAAIIGEIRDLSIEEVDDMVRGADVVSRRWRRAFAQKHTEAALSTLIPDIVDCVVFHLLDVLDNDKIELYAKNSQGDLVPIGDITHGELRGWYFAGGREQYSAERCNPWSE